MVSLYYKTYYAALLCTAFYISQFWVFFPPHNCKLVSCNSEFIIPNYAFISHNSKGKMSELWDVNLQLWEFFLNCEIKSRNYLNYSRNLFSVKLTSTDLIHTHTHIYIYIYTKSFRLFHWMLHIIGWQTFQGVQLISGRHMDKVVPGRSWPHCSYISIRQMISVISKVLTAYNNTITISHNDTEQTNKYNKQDKNDKLFPHLSHKIIFYYWLFAHSFPAVSHNTHKHTMKAQGLVSTGDDISVLEAVKMTVSLLVETLSLAF